MKFLSNQLRFCSKLAVIGLTSILIAPTLHAQQIPKGFRLPPEKPMRSRIFIFDLRDGSSHLVYTADAIWETPNWSADGKYLIPSSNLVIYKFVLKPDGTAEPVKLGIPDEYRCNNDKALSPDGKKIAFSAGIGLDFQSNVYIAAADGSNIKQMTHESPSFFHAWSPDSKTLAYVALRNIDMKTLRLEDAPFDIYAMPAAGGPEQRYTSNPHYDDGPDYSPDGKWIYFDSHRSGKEAIWRFPAGGAGPNDEKAEMVLSDELEDYYPHISPDGKKMVYIGYPAGTLNHMARPVPIEIKMVTIENGKFSAPKTLIEANTGQGTFNIPSWAPDSMRFAYVTFEALP